MKKVLAYLFIFSSPALWACPMCAGSASNPGDQYIVYILGGFVLLTYIPFFLLYRMVIKNRNLNKMSSTAAIEGNGQ